MGVLSRGGRVVIQAAANSALVACGSSASTGGFPGESDDGGPTQVDDAGGSDATVPEGSTGGGGATDSPTADTQPGTLGDGAARDSSAGDSSTANPPHDGSADGAGVGNTTGGDAGLVDGASGSTRVYPPFAAAGGTVADGIVQLNLYRTFVGLGAVTLDAPSSTGCAAHLQYLICAAAAGGGNGYLEHTETGFPQCAVDGGAQAGIESDLAWGESSANRTTVGQSFGQAVDLWINGLYHRTPLLNPGLMKVGAASTQGYNCLDYAASGNTVTARAATPVLFPPSGSSDVPEMFGGNEGPCPTATNPLTATTCPAGGFIVSANFYGWSTGNASAIGAVASATLTDTATGAVVPLFAYYADTVAGHDPAPGYVRNEIALVPQASLAANHSFAVAIQATVSGQAMALAWTFTTGTRAD